MKDLWRFFTYSDYDPYMNLAIEEALIRSILEFNSPNALRVWQHPPIVSIGCFQRPEQKVNIEYCQMKEIRIVRRMSAGGTVYQDSGNLNYSLYIDTNRFKTFKDPVESYSFLCRGLILALKSLGVQAEFKPVNDVIVGMRKISGNAQYELYNVLLHHGTLLMDLNLDNLENALIIPSEKLKDKDATTVRDRVTTINRELTRTVPMSIVREAIQKGYEEALGVEFEDSTLTPEEWKIARVLYKKYSSPEWIFGTRHEFEHHTVYKAPGGLIRVALTISHNTIKQINISGDFFIKPSEALEILEKMLTGVPYTAQTVKQIVDEFYHQNITTPRVSPQDFVAAIMQANIIPS
ncbi:MAG: lipoate--protein ligase [Candidatus Heimdallarchaeota archaeon]